MDKRPLFSVVLPTLGKSRYLSDAIRSVLAQSCDDFELVVSNNSDSDLLHDVVREFNDPRIRYFKTGRKLPIDESYGFALGHSRGEYITFLGDDDAYSQICLERFKEVIDLTRRPRLIACRMCDYYFYDITLNGLDIAANTLSFAPFDNQVHTYSSRAVLQQRFWSAGLSDKAGLEPLGSPLILNAAYHRSLIDSITGQLGYFFPKIIFGDIFTVVAVLSIVDEYLYIDSPLTIHGFSETSLTAIDSIERLKTFVSQNRDYLRPKHVPLSFFTPSNQMADNLLIGKAAMGDRLSDVEITLDGYFRNCLADLDGFYVEGCDVQAEMEEFWSAVSDYDPALKDQLWQERHRLTREAYLGLSKLSRKVGLYKPLKKLLNTSNARYIRGEELGFSGIDECGLAIDSSFTERYAVGRAL